MSVGVVCVGIVCGARVVVTGPLSTSVSAYGGLFSVAVVAVVVSGTSSGGSTANISGI